MTKTETVKILAILKAAYPNSYKGMSKEEANATVTIWAAQFAGIPVEIVMMAVNKLISTNQFPPAISEVKQRISNLYWEARELIDDEESYIAGCRSIGIDAQGEGYSTGQTRALLERIIKLTSEYRTGGHALEMPLKDMLPEARRLMLENTEGGDITGSRLE